MGIIGRLISLLIGGVVLASIVGAVGAAVAKRRIVAQDEPDANEVQIAAIFEPMNFSSTASSFVGGTIDCWYGGGVVDLRGATLDPAGALLRVRAIFGGGQIVVPESWEVEGGVFGLGGFSDARSKATRPADAPHLAIEGVAIFGGFAVVSEIPEAEARALAQDVARWGRRRGAAAGPVDTTV